MVDPILDEIWRVRAELVKQHGGWKNYFAHVQKLDEARRRRERLRRKKKSTSKRRKVKSKATA